MISIQRDLIPAASRRMWWRGQCQGTCISTRLRSEKKKRHSPIWVITFFLVHLIILTIDVNADKIDNTHYRFCVMDDAMISDYAAEDAATSNTLPFFVSSTWYSYNGALIQGDKTIYGVTNNITSVPVLMSVPYNGSDPSIKHFWGKGFNGTVYDQWTSIYIEVNKPSGISISNVPTKMMIGDTNEVTKSIQGSFTPFRGNGFFEYTYSSSDNNVVTFKNSVLEAKKTGTATIKVSLYAKNRKYSGSYLIGSASQAITVVDNMDPEDIALNKSDIVMDAGTSTTIKASLTPSDARTTITWSSSDTGVATVTDGIIKAVGGGNAVIEATTSNGLSAKCYVTVLDDSDYQRVLIDNLYYDLNRSNNTATVVPPEDGEKWLEIISKEIIVPETVEYYGKNFRVTTIGDYAFAGCPVTSILLPESVTKIEAYSFALASIRDIELPSGLKEIGACAFSGSALESIIIGDNVSIIREGAFCDCEALRAMYVSEGNNTFMMYEECLYNKSLKTLYYIPITKKNVKFPDSLETIAPLACTNNRVLSELSLPENLRIIGQAAFAGSHSLETLDFPASLQEIEDNAFMDCEFLREVRFGDKIKIIGENVFTSLELKKVVLNSLTPPTAVPNSFWQYDAMLVVPKGRIATYQKNDVWNRFTTIVDEENIKISDIVLSATSIDMLVGEIGVLIANVKPADATDKTLIWESSDPTVAEVDQHGNISAIGIGSAIITVRSADGEVSASCVVTVNPVLVSEIILSANSLDMVVGDMESLTAQIIPDNATDKTLIWESSDPTVAEVDQNGNISAIGIGSAIITVRSADGEVSASCVVTVNPVLVSEIILSNETLDMLVGETKTLTVKIFPTDASNQNIVWMSSDNYIATVYQSGKVTAKSSGSTTITVRSKDGNAEASCTVNVKDPSAVEGVYCDTAIEVLNLHGIKIADSLERLSPGVYIVRRGNKVEKISVK